MAHPRFGESKQQSWIRPNAGAQFKQNPRSVVKKRLSPGFTDAV